MRQQRVFANSLSTAQRESHIKMSTHLFREAARGPIVISSDEEKETRKKRVDPDVRNGRPTPSKRSRVEPLFIEDLSHTDSGGDSPVRAVNVVNIHAEDSGMLTRNTHATIANFISSI